jgi:hypothetical protein
LEPRVRIEYELAIHGYVQATGEYTLGKTTQQTCTHGAFVGAHTVLSEAVAVYAPSMESEGARVAEALSAAGYFGAFGVDGHVSEFGLVARSEINARYTLGWAVGCSE